MECVLLPALMLETGGKSELDTERKVFELNTLLKLEKGFEKNGTLNTSS